MERKLIFISSRTNEFNGKKYKLDTFLDLVSLQVIYGVDLNYTFTEKEEYNCIIDVVRSKIRVVDVKIK